MHIAVIGTVRMGKFPPGLSLVAALLDLGAEVTLVASSIDEIPESIRIHKAFSAVELGARDTKKEKLARVFDEGKTIRGCLRSGGNRFDAVWTLTDFTARATGKILLDYKHIMNLPELVEYTPAFLRRRMPLHSNVVIELARSAARVVVPEYNRAHIQKVWWKLPKLPAVLPNKPYPDYCDKALDSRPDLRELLEDESRRILLYQGLYARDRDLTQYAEAVGELGDGYSLYLMGRPTRDMSTDIESLCRKFSNVHDLGFVPAPGHLALTKYGHIGLLPYVPAPSGANSVLNPLYCAPNKIWEYSGFGLPMLGSDVPGLTSVFRRYGAGEVSDGSVRGIVDAVLRIESSYDEYSRKSLAFYKSVDVKAIVLQIIREAGLDA